MKKISLVLLVCLFATFCLTACGRAMILPTDAADPAKPAETGTTSETPETKASEEVSVTVLDNDAYLALEEAMNADGDEGLSFGDFGYVYFGSFPQTIAEKDALKEMSSTTDETGYYYSTFDNAHYGKVTTSDVYGNKYEFTNERTIERRKTYYFKVEPIKWRVFAQVGLTGNLVQVYLVSTVVLDSMAFLNALDYEETARMDYVHKNNAAVPANNWAYSALRKWMNGEFYKNAFTAKEKQKMTSTPVSDVTDVFDPEDASDYVTAPSLSQVQSMPTSYLMAQTTDYARCRGTFMSVYSNWYGNGRYWLTTPGAASYQTAYVADYRYSLLNSDDKDKTISATGESVGATYMGVRPVISLSVSDLASILAKDEEEE